jgi:hypothetical protein
MSLDQTIADKNCCMLHVVGRLTEAAVIVKERRIFGGFQVVIGAGGLFPEKNLPTACIKKGLPCEQPPAK